MYIYNVEIAVLKLNCQHFVKIWSLFKEGNNGCSICHITRSSFRKEFEWIMIFVFYRKYVLIFFFWYHNSILLWIFYWNVYILFSFIALNQDGWFYMICCFPGKNWDANCYFEAQLGSSSEITLAVNTWLHLPLSLFSVKFSFTLQQMK